MATWAEARLELTRYALDRGQWMELSGPYDLFPDHPHVADAAPLSGWPAVWPLGDYHGVYLFLSDEVGGPYLLYIGRSSRPSSCLRARLNGYVDLAEYRRSGRCVAWIGSNAGRDVPRISQSGLVTDDQIGSDSGP